MKTRSSSDFEFGGIIGEGSYSTVLFAKEKESGLVFAAKVLDKKQTVKEKKVKYVSIERDVFQICAKHPSIIQLYYTFQDHNSLYFILELAENGNLFECLKSFGKLELYVAKFLIAELCCAVDYLHGHGVLHRDLKPENVLLTNLNHIKLTDFGSAKILNNGIVEEVSDTAKRYSFVGTAEYCSPELLNDRIASEKSDIWAIACILFQLLVGEVPFKGGSEYLTFQLILKQDFTFPDTIDSDAKNLISKILIMNPEARPSFGQIMLHSFFSSISWNNLFSSTSPLIYIYKPAQLSRLMTSSESIDELEHRQLGTHQSINSQKLPVSRSSTSINTFATQYYASLLNPDEQVIIYGLVLKRKFIRSKKYLLLLTTFKRILFVDPSTMIVKKQVFSDISATYKDINHFILNFHNKSYQLQVHNNNAPEWVKEIQKHTANTSDSPDEH